MKNIIISYVKYVAISFVIILALQYTMLWAHIPVATIQNVSDAIILCFPIVGIVLDVMVRRINARNEATVTC
ncbi:MAG: hypothetical protein IJ419_09755 [Agathobacter sp.]|nr:hypothetical protein [Agathobacter sp.]